MKNNRNQKESLNKRLQKAKNIRTKSVKEDLTKLIEDPNAMNWADNRSLQVSQRMEKIQSELKKDDKSFHDRNEVQFD
jgi:hypothetical protein